MDTKEINLDKHKEFVETVIGDRRQKDVQMDIADKGEHISLGSISEFISLRDPPTKNTVDKLLLLIPDPERREELRSEAYQNYDLLKPLEKSLLLEKQATKALKLALLDKGISYKEEDCNIHDLSWDSTKRFDWCISLEDGPIGRWFFELRCNNSKMRNNNIFQMISRVLYPTTPEEKISLVVDDPKLYEDLLKKTSMRGMPFPYRGDFSIILVDTKTVEVLEEKYISHYFLETEKQNEILLK